MDESIGYEALFSSEDWESIEFADELDFEDSSPDGEPAFPHSVTIYDPPGERAGNEAKFEIECERCGVVGTTDSKPEADAIARLHAELLATLVDNWDIQRGLGESAAQHLANVTADSEGFEIVCPQCGEVGSADDSESASLLKRLHDLAFRLAASAGEEVA